MKRLHGYIFLSLLAFVATVMSSCRSAKLSEADAAFERGEYFDAQKIYRQVYNRLDSRKDRQQRGEVAFAMAGCYTKLNMADRAAAACQNAIRYGYPDSTVYLMLGRALQATGKYQQAIEAYDDFMRYRPESLLAEEGIRGCRMAISAKERGATRYVVRNMKTLNTRRADYAPMFAGIDFDRLYITSTSEKATGQKVSGITGMKNGDIFVSRKDERGQWQRPEPAKGEINSDADEGIVSFSPDGQTMYLTRAPRSESHDTSVEIMTSRRTDAAWSAPQPFPIGTDTLSAIGHPSVSRDGNWLYFASDRPGGFGGLDIWRISLTEPGAMPHNLGPQINTEGNESFPFSRSDSLLYFASDGHPGFGGLDIFKATLNSTGDYWSVDNMGIPVNSRGDDFGITFGPGESGFLSSNRDDARGHDHIYSFELPDLRIFISGRVIDRDEEPVAGAVIRIVGDDGTNQKETSRDDGSFRFRLDRGVRYVMKAGAPGYLNLKQEFTSDAAEEDAEYAVDFILTALNKPQVAENIFYDFDKATLRPESRTALDEIVQILRDNPYITMEMASHTDRKGSEEYNMKLSERRARSVVDYLIKAGIEEERLSPKGYGKSRPKTVTKKIAREYPQFPEGTALTEEYILTLSSADREAADQINRRTEFLIKAN